jgi:hypothetical protein
MEEFFHRVNAFIGLKALVENIKRTLVQPEYQKWPDVRSSRLPQVRSDSARSVALKG